MKKSIVIIAILTVSLAFAGCGSTVEQFSLEPFASNVTLKTDGLEIKGTVEYTSATEMSLIVLTPENIAGIKIETLGGEIKMYCRDMEFTTASLEKLTKGNDVFGNLFEALGSLGNGTFEIDTQKKNNIKGDYAFGAYSAVIDGGTKRIASLDAGGKLYIFS